MDPMITRFFNVVNPRSNDDSIRGYAAMPKPRGKVALQKMSG